MMTIVIPTLGREAVLVDTLQKIITLPAGKEIILVDQTLAHEAATAEALHAWEQEGKIRWIHQQPPGVVAAMNRGLREAKNPLVLFLDDDIEPDAGLLEAHAAAHQAHPDAWAVVGRVIQPEGDALKKRTRRSSHGNRLTRDLDFDFSADQEAWVENVMAGNMSVRRERALAIGGFDENFIPPVAYRFETEFAKRVVAAGGRIRYEPGAIIHHLRAPRGGTRSIGSHLTSASPLHGVGDYCYAMKCGRGLERILYILRRPLREICTRFHLRRPWWIPVKLVGEIRALFLAISLRRRGSLR